METNRSAGSLGEVDETIERRMTAEVEERTNWKWRGAKVTDQLWPGGRRERFSRRYPTTVQLPWYQWISHVWIRLIRVIRVTRVPGQSTRGEPDRGWTPVNNCHELCAHLFGPGGDHPV